MNRKICYGRCSSTIGGKTDFYAPVVKQTSGLNGTGYAAAIANQSNADFAVIPFTAQTVVNAPSNFAINGQKYAVTGGDYLTPAGVTGAPGLWIYGFTLYVPSTVGAANPGALDNIAGNYPDYPWQLPAVMGIALPNASDVGTGDMPGCPWPLPYIPSGSPDSLQEVVQLDSVYGVKFVDQFGNPYPMNPGLIPTSTGFAGTGTQYHSNLLPGFVSEFPYVQLDSPYALVTCSVGFGHGFAVPDLVRADKTRLLCYPKFTWDLDRMTAVSNWFMQWPAKIRYQRGPGGFDPLDPHNNHLDVVTVDGHLVIDPTQITYGPVHFVLNRPPCKYAGILNACS